MAMKITQKNKLGSVEVSLEAIADLAGLTASSVYGIVGLVNKKNFANPLSQFLNKEDYADGVSARKGQKGYEVSLYLVVSKDVKVAEVVYEVQKQVGYVLKKNFGMDFSKINVYVQAVR